MNPLEFYKKLLTLTLILFSFQAIGQNIWGAGGEGAFTDGLNGWTIENTTNDCGWEIWDDGFDDRGAWSNASLESPTSETGTVVFNSDFLDNGGDQGGAGTGSCPAPQARGSLVSPLIDLTGFENEKIGLTFWQSFRQFQSVTVIEYTFNDVDWFELPVNNEVPLNEFSPLDFVEFAIPFSDTEGQSQLRVKFTFVEGNYYFWMIDDVNVIVGNQPSIFWEEGDFTGGLNGWTTDNFIDTCGWEFWQNGSDDRGAWGSAVINSPSASTGTVVFNSDYMDNNGSQDPEDAGRGRCPAAQDGSLVSPVISLAGIEQEQLAISFWQTYRHNNGPGRGTFVEFSFDNGTTWEGREVNTDVDNNGAAPTEQMTFNIPFLASQGQTSLQFRFRTSLDYYYWMVDDVQLISAACVDLVAPANDFYAIAPNFETPVSQIQEIAFLNDIANVGACDLDNVTLTATIADTSGAILHMDQLNYGTVAAGTDVQNIPFADTYTMLDKVGPYIGNYSIASEDLADFDSTNNSISFLFRVSENVYSKERGQQLIEANLARGNWDPTERTSWGFGNHFYVPNGGGYVVSNLSVGVTGASNTAGESYEVILFKITDDGDGSFSHGSEREIVGSTSIDIAGDGTQTLIDVVLEADDGSEFVRLEDDTHYLAWVQFDDSDTELAIGLLFDEEFDYGAMDLAFDSLPGVSENPNLNRYGSFLIIDEDLTSPMTSTSRVPVIRMSICPEGDLNCLTVATNDPLPSDNKISLFPNPSSNEINLKLDLTQNEDYARVNIVDITGKTIMSYELNNVQFHTETINIADIPSGSYVMQYISETGTRSMKFVKH